MRRTLLTLLLFVSALASALLVGSPASAITNGTPDGNRHPAVGALVSPTQYSDGTWTYCSGTLISPTSSLPRLIAAPKASR
jgi:hypothetical protein